MRPSVQTNTNVFRPSIGGADTHAHYVAGPGAPHQIFKLRFSGKRATVQRLKNITLLKTRCGRFRGEFRKALAVVPGLERGLDMFRTVREFLE